MIWRLAAEGEVPGGKAAASGKEETHARVEKCNPFGREGA